MSINLTMLPILAIKKAKNKGEKSNFNVPSSILINFFRSPPSSPPLFSLFSKVQIQQLEDCALDSPDRKYPFQDFNRP